MTAINARSDRAVIERALSLLANASRVSPPLRDAVAAVEGELRHLWGDQAAAEEFVLDRTENPHPRMLTEAWGLRSACEGLIDVPGAAAAEVRGKWLGFLQCMCAATGESSEAITAWMERNG